MELSYREGPYGPIPYFSNVEEKFLNFKPGCRCLTARHFDEPSIYFRLKNRYLPGENKYFPKGGFEVVSASGGIYNFFLDEVIVHPYELGMLKYFSKNEKIRQRIQGTAGKRGRPAMSPEEKALKAHSKTHKQTTGKRGRPRLNKEDRVESRVYQPTGGKRGRPKKSHIVDHKPDGGVYLDFKAAAAKSSEKSNRGRKPKNGVAAAKYVPTGAKRGRPKKIG